MKLKIFGIILCFILFSNVLIVSGKGNSNYNLTLKLTPEKTKFPRLYRSDNYCNFTVNVTNHGPETSSYYEIWFHLFQSWPSTRVPNEHYKMEKGNFLKPGESHIMNIRWKAFIMAPFIGFFPISADVSTNDNNKKDNHARYFILVFDMYNFK
jgi:hypothetical protein